MPKHGTKARPHGNLPAPKKKPMVKLKKRR